MRHGSNREGATRARAPFCLVLFLAVLSGAFGQEDGRCRRIIEQYGLAVQSWDAKSLNVLGFQLYTRGLLAPAAELFRCAIGLDGEYDLPHYNLACMLSLLHGQRQRIDMDELFEALQTSLYLSPSLIENVKEDSDLDSLRGMERFAELVRENELHTMVARFKGVNAFEAKLSFLFTDEQGKTVWVNHSRVNLREMGFYSDKSSKDSFFPEYVANEEFVGKAFTITYRIATVEGEFSGMPEEQTVIVAIEPR